VKLARQSHLIAGYDCRVECQHTPKGEHGQSSSEWLYIIGSGDAALTLIVMSGEYPDGTRRPPDARDLTLHVAWRTEQSDVRSSSLGEGCDYVDGGRCFRAASTIVGARDFFVAHGQSTFEQPESFWTALEDKFAVMYGTAERADDRFKQCPTCVGEGVIEKGAGWPDNIERTSDAALRLGTKPDSRCGEFYLNGWRAGADRAADGRNGWAASYIRTQYGSVRRHAGNEQIARALVRGYRDGRRAGRRARQMSTAEVLW